MWFRPIPEIEPGDAGLPSGTDLDALAEASGSGPAVIGRGLETQISQASDREFIYHPWLTTWVGPKTTAAGVIGCVAAAVLTGFVFNTGYVLSTATGMPDGQVKSALTAVAEPVHSWAQGARLNLFSDGIQTALGRQSAFTDEFDTSSVLALVEQSQPSNGPLGGGPSGASIGVPLIPVAPDTSAPPIEVANEPTQAAREPALLPKLIAPYAKNAPPRQLPVMSSDLTQPSADDRLKVLIAGDSLSTYPGFLMQEQLADIDLVRSKLIWHNGTGLTKPRLLDWRAYLAEQVERRNADVVVMFLGANDMGSLTKKGKVIPPHSDQWRGEYALRVVAVTDAALKAGASSVIWVGPPTARSKQTDKYYRDINVALGAADDVIDDLYVIDLSTGVEYKEAGRSAGRVVPLRQADGIHWTRAGSSEPANAILTVLETGYPSLAPKLQAAKAEEIG